MAIQPTSQQPPAEEEVVNLAMSRSTFEMAKQFVSALKQAIDAADSKIKADLKSTDAEGKMAELAAAMGQQGGGAPSDLAGLGSELSAASDQRMGL
jgi:hypothetical protein